MLATYKREFLAYFNNMTGPLFISVLTIFVGIYFMINNMYTGYPYFSYSLYGSIFVFLLIVPVLTMRSIAEDRHSKTDQLLMTAPVSVAGIVLGKFFAMATVFFIPVCLYAFCPLIIKFNGNSFLASDYASILAFFVLGCLYLSIGMFISSLTESQIISAVGTFFVLLVLHLWGDLVEYVPTSTTGSLAGFWLILLLASILLHSLSNNWRFSAGLLAGGTVLLVGTYLYDSSLYFYLLSDTLKRFNLRTAFENFTYYQMFDMSGLLMYLSLTALMVFLTIQTVQKRRWS